jgi:hypothetical protein
VLSFKALPLGKWGTTEATENTESKHWRIFALVPFVQYFPWFENSVDGKEVFSVQFLRPVFTDRMSRFENFKQQWL